MAEIWGDVVQVSIIVGALVLFGWMVLSSNRTKGDDCELIDPDDAHQVGMLIGLAGGTIGDAVVVKYALERFEQQHGRKATTRDIGVLIGLIRNRG